MRCRWIIRRDMPFVLDIENRNSAEIWPEDEFFNHLRCRNVIGMVATDDSEEVIGFMLYELHKQKLNVIKFVADKNKESVFELMVDILVGKLSKDRRFSLLFDVEESNLALAEFLKNRDCWGYAVVDGLIKMRYDYKPTPDELDNLVERLCYG